MTDRGVPVQFGFFPAPETSRLPQTRADVDYADRAGLDLVGIQDHPYQARYLDTLSLIAALAARTERIRFFPDVANLPLRPPAVLATVAATIDVLSGGRFELGLGAGGFWDAIAAMGGPRRTPGEALAATEEAIDVIQLMWGGERSVRYGGRHYALHGAHPGPRPAHPIGIWVGAAGPRMLALIGRKADGWVPSLPYIGPQRLPEAMARIDDAAAASGRSPADVRRIYNIDGRITDGARGEGVLDGPVEHWVATLTGWVTQMGLDTFVLWPSGDDPSDQLRRFAEEVVPATRAAVATARGQA